MTINAYTRIAANAARTTLAHRVGFVLGTFGATFQLVAMVALWTALLKRGAYLGGFSLDQMKAYLIVGYITGVLGTALGEQVMSDRIRSGDVAIDLVRPLDYQGMRFAEVLGGMCVEIILVVIVGTTFWMVAGPVSAPAQPALFAISLVAVLPIKFLIFYMSTLLCFWTQNYHGVAWARSALSLILSGALVPLALLPHWLQTLSNLLPFASITSTPALIFAGRADPGHSQELILVQSAWVAILWFAGRLAWRGAVRQLTVHGG